MHIFLGAIQHSFSAPLSFQPEITLDCSTARRSQSNGVGACVLAVGGFGRPDKIATPSDGRRSNHLLSNNNFVSSKLMAVQMPYGVKVNILLYYGIKRSSFLSFSHHQTNHLICIKSDLPTTALVYESSTHHSIAIQVIYPPKDGYMSHLPTKTWVYKSSTHKNMGIQVIYPPKHGYTSHLPTTTLLFRVVFG